MHFLNFVKKKDLIKNQEDIENPKIKNERKDDNTLIINDNYILELINNKSYTYIDILIYNCFNPETNCIDLNKLNNAIDDTVEVYQKLFDVSSSISAFQFVGIFLQSNGQDFIALEIKFAYFILSVGFLVSMLGVLLSFITIEYLRGIRDEEPDFIIVGMKEYKSIFKFADKIIYLNCICFIAPIIILIYTNIGYRFGITFNTIAGILFIFGLLIHYLIIIRKQKYKYNGTNYEYIRKIYKNK
jgi:hypothetical protein